MKILFSNPNRSIISKNNAEKNSNNEKLTYQPSNDELKISFKGDKIPKLKYVKLPINDQTNYDGYDLENCRIISTEIKTAGFQRAKISGFKAIEATLPEANFSNSKLWDIDFSGSDLSNAKFNKANISDFHVGICPPLMKTTSKNPDELSSKAANFSGADFSGAKFYSNLKISGADLNAVNYNKKENKYEFPDRDRSIIGTSEVVMQNFSNTKFVEATIMHSTTEFNYVDFKNADFTNTDLRGCKFYYCDLTNANFSCNKVFRRPNNEHYDGYMSGIDFRHSKLNGADFTKTEINKAAFFDCDLTGAKGFNPTKAFVDETTITPEGNPATGEWAESFGKNKENQDRVIFCDETKKREMGI